MRYQNDIWPTQTDLFLLSLVSSQLARVSKAMPESNHPKGDPIGNIRCLDRERLEKHLEKIQVCLNALIASQFDAFQASDESRFWSLKKEEGAVREQQAHTQNELREHILLHRCRPRHDGLL